MGWVSTILLISLSCNNIHVNVAATLTHSKRHSALISDKAQPTLVEAFLSTEVSEDATSASDSLPDFPKMAKEARDDFKRKCEVLVTVSDEKFLPIAPLKRFCETTEDPMECRLQVTMRLKETHARDGDMGQFCSAVYDWFQSKYGMKCPKQCRKLQCKPTCLWLDAKKEANEESMDIKDELQAAEEEVKALKELSEAIASKIAEGDKAKFIVSMGNTREDRAKKALAAREADLKAGETKLDKVNNLVLDIEANITVIKDNLIKLEDEVTKQTFQLDKDELKFEDMGRTAKRLIDKVDEQVKEEKSLLKESKRIEEEMKKLTDEKSKLSKRIDDETEVSGKLKTKLNDKIAKVQKAWEELEEFRVDKSEKPTGSSWDEIAQKWIHGNYVDDDRVPETRELVENQYKRAKEAQSEYEDMQQKIKDLKEEVSDMDRQLSQFGDESSKIDAAEKKANTTAKQLIADTKKQENDMKDFKQNTIKKAKDDLESLKSDKEKTESSLETATKTLKFTQDLQEQQKSHVQALKGYVSQAEMSLDQEKKALTAAQDTVSKITDEVKALTDEETEKKGKMETTAKSLNDRIATFKKKTKELFMNRPEAVRLHGLKPAGNLGDDTSTVEDFDDSNIAKKMAAAVAPRPTTTATTTTTTTTTPTTTTTTTKEECWNKVAGKYLSGYTDTARDFCFTEEEAKSLCAQAEDCGGLTIQDNVCGGSKWTLRKGNQGKPASGTAQYNARSIRVDRNICPVTKACFKDLPGQYLSSFTTTAGDSCFTEEEAKTLCQQVPSCGGITRAGDLCGGDKWTLREGASGKVSGRANNDSPKNMWSKKIVRDDCEEIQMPTFSGVYNVKSVLSGKYMNVDGNSKSNGGNIVTYEDPHRRSSQWRISPAQTAGAYVFTNVNSGLIANIEANSMKNGGNIHQWNNPEWIFSQWRIYKAPTPGAYLIANVKTGKVVNIKHDVMSNGASIIQWDNPPDKSSQWYLEELPKFSGHTYNIKSVLAGKYLNVQGGSKSNGGNIQLWDNPGDPATQWTISGEQGNYVITNVNSGKVLNVQGNSKSNGGNIQLWDNPNNVGSQWSITKAATNGAYLIMNVNSGKLVNIQHDAKDNGANIHQWDNPGDTSSQWYLEAATPAKPSSNTDCQCYHCGTNDYFDNADVCARASSTCSGNSPKNGGCWSNRDHTCVCKTKKIVQACECFHCGGNAPFNNADVCGAASNTCGPSSPANGGCWNNVDGATCQCDIKQTTR